MPIKKYFILDFDSTFIQVEALEELAAIALKKHPHRQAILEEMKNITNRGMEGKLPFAESLEKRLQLLQANRKDLDLLVKRLRRKLSVSIARNKAFFKKYANQIYVVSGGFKEFILPIVEKYYIPAANVFANTFIFDDQGTITGFDKNNPASQKDGKAALLKSLKLDGDIYVIGDGYTDYQMRAAGLANKFFAFTENVQRENVLSKADHIAPSLDEILYLNKLPMAISYPKNRIQVLLLENIHPDAADVFNKEGYQVEVVPGSLDETELAEKLRQVSILGIRSKTKLTPKVLENANRLMAIGAFCIGTDQIDLGHCLKRGIPVFNAPYSNTRSVVELAIGEIIILIRSIFEKSNKLREGIWDKSVGGNFEVRGKKLGIIGYGKIGSQLSVLAEFLGMEVFYYDVQDKLALGNAKKCATMPVLLRKADIISMHVDGDPHNFHLIGEKEFRSMKNGVIFLNLSRGFIVEEPALIKYLRNGKIKGAAIDVFPDEPGDGSVKFASPLQDFPNVILTPHIGGSTEEAQKNIAEFVSGKIIDYINSGNSFFSVNFPNIQLPELQRAHRLIHIHQNTPGMLAQINGVLAGHQINIIGQYLKTNEEVGYVITDISKKYDRKVIRDLRKIPHTIKFRMLY